MMTNAHKRSVIVAPPITGRADIMYMQMSSDVQILRERQHHTRSVKHIKEGGKILHLVPD